ncbi:MAG: ArsR family transcriptional regulator [Spirulina sp. DLM2.Bin59]|nr:MAG: ArsR family transcriptional regulator [Spirulina sp. DLM2.Bin59]
MERQTGCPLPLPQSDSLRIPVPSPFCIVALDFSAMHHDNITHYADLLAALGTPARLTIVRLLVKKYPHALTATEIQARLKIPAPILHQHLNKLCQQGVLHRSEAPVSYSVDVNLLEDLLAFFYAECCVRQRVIDWGRVNDKKEQWLTASEVATVEQESLENFIDAAIYDRLGGKVLQALLLAQSEAIRTNYSAIGAEHLLLGLILEGSGLATHHLKEWGLTAIQIREAIGNPTGQESPHDIPFSEEATAILNSALVVANESGAILINTEHILLGFLLAWQKTIAQNQPPSLICQMFQRLTVPPEVMIQTMRENLN